MQLFILKPRWCNWLHIGEHDTDEIADSILGSFHCAGFCREGFVLRRRSRRATTSQPLMASVSDYGTTFIFSPSPICEK
jgi:hypothetical protein